MLVCCALGCGANDTTKIGGITSTNPFCIGLVHATGFCAAPPSNAAHLHVDDCVRVTYRADDYPTKVTITNVTAVSAAQHRRDCPE